MNILEKKHNDFVTLLPLQSANFLTTLVYKERVHIK